MHHQATSRSRSFSQENSKDKIVHVKESTLASKVDGQLNCTDCEYITCLNDTVNDKR